MNDVIITGVVHGGSKRRVGIGNCEPGVFGAKVDFEYRPQKADGSLDAGIHFKYDLKAHKVG